MAHFWLNWTVVIPYLSNRFGSPFYDVGQNLRFSYSQHHQDYDNRCLLNRSFNDSLMAVKTRSKEPIPERRLEVVWGM